MIHQGSRVKYVGDDPRWKGKTGVVLRVMDYSEDGRENYYWIDFPGRPSLPESELVAVNSHACNSTNPVVANAMRARNATYQYHDYDVPVIQLGQRKYITIMGVADEETAKALARSSPGITIDESRKVKVNNASGGVARNAMQDTGSYVQECNKFIPEANAMIREWDAFYKKMTAKRKWYDSKMTELRDGFYRIDKGDPDYDKARAAYDALRDVSRSAEAVHLFYSV